MMPTSLSDTIRSLCPYTVRKIVSESKWLIHQRLLRGRKTPPSATSESEARSVADIFTGYYHRNHWGNDESRSGPGSDMFHTKTIRAELPSLLKRYGIKSMLDLPCGDFYWMQHVDLKGVQYIGADVVEPMIADNRKQFAGPDRSFEVLNLLEDDLPQVDLIFARHVLFHFSYEKIHAALHHIKASGSKYLMTSTHPRGKNINIATGRSFHINLQAQPFGFPEPVACINDYSWGHPVCYMALWKIEDLPEQLPLKQAA